MTNRKPLFIILFSLGYSGIYSQEQQVKKDSVYQLQEIVVSSQQILGSKFKARNRTGSAYYISPEEIRRLGYTDINRMLKAVPGVNMYEEDGFGFAPTPQGYEKIPQIGIVILEDNVEVGANTCIDRATMGATVIHSGVKLDNLVQIAHNDEIGSHTVMAAQVGIAGSTKVGEWCMFGGQVGIAGHLKIGNQVNLGAQSGVPGNIKSGSQLIGTPPMELKQFFKASIVQKSLPEMQIELRNLRKEIEELKQQLNK